MNFTLRLDIFLAEAVPSLSLEVLPELRSVNEPFIAIDRPLGNLNL